MRRRSDADIGATLAGYPPSAPRSKRVAKAAGDLLRSAALLDTSERLREAARAQERAHLRARLWAVPERRVLAGLEGIGRAGEGTQGGLRVLRRGRVGATAGVIAGMTLTPCDFVLHDKNVIGWGV